jgi:hypothetical protein
MKQGFVTLVLFNIFNISFSAGVHWKYASPTDYGYILSSIILYGTLIAMVAGSSGHGTDQGKMTMVSSRRSLKMCGSANSTFH